MENAVEALKMAAAVLVFVLALGISMSSFSEVRQVSQIIFNYTDKEYSYTYIPDKGSTTRNVGVETIIPAIYRSYNEKFNIYFYEGTTDRKYTIYQQRANSSSPLVDVNKFDLSQITLVSVEERNDFIGCILYGNRYEKFTELSNKLRQRTPQIILQNEGLYDKIKSSSGVKEMFGIYEQQDLLENVGSEVPENNQTKIRTISYIINPTN